MNAKKARLLRWVARANISETDNELQKANINVKAVKSGKLVFNAVGVAMEEQVPVVTFEMAYKPGSFRPVYKEIKKNYKAGLPL